jgi:glycosyltransferase involved in cell wall biosynthesis
MVDQAEAWSFLGHEVACFYLKNDGLYQDQKKVFDINTKSSFFTHFWYFFRFYNALCKVLSYQQFDLVILRYAPISLGLNRLASKLKKKNPEIKLVIDLPTYPFHQEYSFGKQVLLKLLKGERYRLKNQFDSILHLGHEETVFGIPTIRISNGVNVETYRAKTNFDTPIQKMRLIFIGSLFKWQNIKSLLLAIEEYLTEKPNIDLSLKIIGAGPELERLRALVMSRPLLNTRVFFIPPLYGNELDEYINESEIGIGYLGGSNRDVTTLSPLKHRHFAARGLPFAYRCTDEEFENKNFALKLSPKPLSKESISQIAQWYLDTKEGFEELNTEMRDFAASELNWEKQCEKIIDQLDI